MDLSGTVSGAGAGLTSGNPYLAAAGAGLGAIGDIFGGLGPQYVYGLDPEDRDQAIQKYQKAFGRTQDLSMAPVKVGGYTLNRGGILNKKQVKSKYLPQAAADYLIEKGYDPDEARAKVSDFQDTNRPNFKKALGKKFLNFLREKGGKYNLKVRQGKIRGRDTETVGGSFSMDDLPEMFSGMSSGDEGSMSPAREAALKIAAIFGGEE